MPLAVDYDPVRDAPAPSRLYKIKSGEVTQGSDLCKYLKNLTIIFRQVSIPVSIAIGIFSPP